MKNVSRYRLEFAAGRKPVDLLVEVTEHRYQSPLTVSGRVMVEVHYWDPNEHPHERVFRYKEEFGIVHDKLVLRIIDFILPPALGQCGIGTFIWSAIYRNLDSATASRLRLQGGLSSKDATVTQVDGVGRIARTYQDGISSRRTMPNTERRNRFWRRMLSQNERVFVCREDGGGHFDGWFVDPARDPSYGPGFVVRGGAC